MAVTEQDRKRNAKMMNLYMSIILGIVCAYLFAYGARMAERNYTDIINGIMLACANISQGQLLFFPSAGSILGIFGGILIGAIVYVFMSLDTQIKHTYKEDEVAGTGGFMDRKELAEYAKEYITPDPPPIKDNLPVQVDLEHDKEMYSQNMIMSNKFCRPINSRRIIGNNNVLIVGGAGTGKSRFFIKPNVLQMNASYVITDPSGEMIKSLGKVLKDHGYKIKIFNISDMAHSNCYNPMVYIRDEAGVNMLIECLINNTTKGETAGDNQFFVDAEKLLYSACIFYLKDYCYDDSKKNFAGVMSMINASSVNELDPTAKSPLDELFDKLPKSSLAWKYYKAFKQAAGKTLKSIIISCVTRLQPFLTPQVANLTSSDNIELGKLGDEKTALFIITPQADRTYSFLASMLYSQLFETLYYLGEQQMVNTGSEQMKVPVRCMMDEFANIGEVPEFPSKLATMRKYNISAAIVLQDIAQIEAMYEDNWKTLVGNCSTIIFLGTQEPNTLKYFSDMLGKMTIRTRSDGLSTNAKSGKGGSQNYQNTGREVMTPDELGRMPSDECIVFTQNKRPVRDKKYIYENHPYYDQTADADPENAFRYNKLSAYDNTKAGNISSLIKAASEAARFRQMQQKKKLGSLDDKRVSGDMRQEFDRYSMGERDDKAAYKERVNDVLQRFIDMRRDPFCIVKVENVPFRMMRKMAEEIMARTKCKKLLLFSEVSVNEKDNDMIGVAIDGDPTVKPDLNSLKNSLIKDMTVKGNVAVIRMNRHLYDEYRTIVLEEIS